MRDPSTKAWTRTLEQIYLSEGGEKPVIRSSGIHLSEEEYEVLAHLEGGEIRKNRYFHEFDRCEFVFDVYLGKLWGVCTAKVEFASEEERDEFRPPPFAKIEVTGNPFFMGANLVTKNFDDVQEELRAKLDV